MRVGQGARRRPARNRDTGPRRCSLTTGVSASRCRHKDWDGGLRVGYVVAHGGESIPALGRTRPQKAGTGSTLPGLANASEATPCTRAATDCCVAAPRALRALVDRIERPQGETGRVPPARRRTTRPEVTGHRPPLRIGTVPGRFATAQRGCEHANWVIAACGSQLP